jgi:hypothetical protein
MKHPKRKQIDTMALEKRTTLTADAASEHASAGHVSAIS